jgi:hypothetical protein
VVLLGDVSLAVWTPRGIFGELSAAIGATDRRLVARVFRVVAVLQAVVVPLAIVVCVAVVAHVGACLLPSTGLCALTGIGVKIAGTGLARKGVGFPE